MPQRKRNLTYTHRSHLVVIALVMFVGVLLVFGVTESVEKITSNYFPIDNQNNILGITTAPPYQKLLSNMNFSTGLLNWRDWYPVNFGQPENHRMLNRWTSVLAGKGQFLKGLSYLNVPNNVPTLPTGKDYFFLWQCRSALLDRSDEHCYDQTFYREIISTDQADALDTWARGSSTQYEVYYDPEQIGYNNCDKDRIEDMSINLNSPLLKKPLVFKLPNVKDGAFVSSPVCALVFRYYSQNNMLTLDSRYDGGNYTFENGNWIVIAVTHDIYKDFYGRDIIRAENIYLTDNYAAANRFSSKYCQGINPLDSLHCLDGHGITYTLGERTYGTFAYEEYWMRKTAVSGKYPGVTDRSGFGAFRWWSNGMNDIMWDRITNTGAAVNDAARHQEYVMQSCVVDENLWTSNCTNL